MVNKVLFDHLTSGIVNGLVKSGFGIGDGLDYESGSSDESDGEYVLRAFYLRWCKKTPVFRQGMNCALLHS